MSRTVDHIIPRNKGGNNTKKNLVHACNKCNSLKDNFLPEEFISYLELQIANGCRNQGRLVTIIKNTKALIERIAPYREELYFLSEADRELQRHTAHILAATNLKKVSVAKTAYIEQATLIINHKPSNYKQELAQKDFIERFKKKFPHAFELLCQSNPDLPRWLHDNIVNNKYFLTSQ